MTPYFSILTATRNPALIKPCVESIIRNTSIVNWEMLILWNGEGELLFSDPRIKIINDKFISFSSANNRLATLAGGQFLAIMNDDVQIHYHCIERMIYAMEMDKEIGVTGAKLLYTDGTIQHCGVVFQRNQPGHAFYRQNQSPVTDKDRAYQAVTGALMVCRKEDFIAVGGFDEQYQNCFEDVDLCFKMRFQLNRRVVYCARASAIHLETQTRQNTIAPWARIFVEKWNGKIINDAGVRNEGEKKITFITCVNREDDYKKIFYSSIENCKDRGWTAIKLSDKKNATEGLNEGIKKANTNILVLCHQDVSLPQDFTERLYQKIEKYPNFGVIGVAGRKANGECAGGCVVSDGHVYGDLREGEVLTLDECLLVIRKNSGLRFDETVKGWHFYGADLCLQAARNGLKNYAVDIPVKHHGVGTIDSTYWPLMAAFKHKWENFYPIVYLTHCEYSPKGMITYIK
jgi:GT2 family glycosyltransferase